MLSIHEEYLASLPNFDNGKSLGEKICKVLKII